MLKIYEEILDLKFALVKDAPTWHPDVILYEVTDGSSGELMGHIYMDLFPRDGKYTHAACFELQPGYLLDRETGARQYPATAMVANFSKPTQTKPSLLKHNEVVKLFHELGHAMHNICSLANYARFHGTNVELDFAEAPSQMLENWCWDAQTLKRLSGHYLCPEEKLTNEQIAQLVRTRNVNVGLFNLGQAFLGVFDMALHSIQKPLSETFDGETVERLCSRLRGEIVLIPPQQNISYSSSFAHIMKSYDAGYYGYLWSRVFSADMFHSRFEKEGLQDARVGLDYRHKILKPGGSRDGMESLIDFLGRKPNSEAFFKSLGLQ
jgi:Zn-dependent oligopeptidase